MNGGRGWGRAKWNRCSQLDTSCVVLKMQHKSWVLNWLSTRAAWNKLVYQTTLVQSFCGTVCWYGYIILVTLVVSVGSGRKY